MRDNLCTERPELFASGDSVRPGILVLINDADWELEGQLDYELQANDEILFISTVRCTGSQSLLLNIGREHSSTADDDELRYSGHVQSSHVISNVDVSMVSRDLCCSSCKDCS